MTLSRESRRSSEPVTRMALSTRGPRYSAAAPHHSAQSLGAGPEQLQTAQPTALGSGVMSGNSSGSSSGPLAGGRRSPRVSYSAGAASRVPRLSISSRVGGGGALSDITNVLPGRTQSDFAAKTDVKGCAAKSSSRQSRKPPPLQGPVERLPSNGHATCTVAAPPGEYRSQQSCHNEVGASSCGRNAVHSAASVSSAEAAVPSASPRASLGSPFRGDAENVQAVVEYVSDVCSMLFREEAAYVPRPGFLDQQTDINVKMRAILIDWLTEVHMKYRLRAVTMFLTVNIIDRYLAKTDVARKCLQLVGVVAMLIAAKFEEVRPPQVADFVYITDKAYTKTEITNLESVMLVALGFKIRVPTVLHFLDRLHAAARCDAVQKEVTNYLAELALMDYRSARHAPSHLAAAAMLLSNELLGRTPVWPPALVRHSRYSEASLRTCACELRALLAAAPTAQFKAMYKKYSSAAHHGVAKMPSLAAG